WAGYVGSTGLAAMDYLLADSYEIPAGAEAHYSERVLRLPEGYVCYAPPAYAPPVSTLPCRAGQPVTFGSFNHPAKLNAAVIALWAEVLAQVPAARLLLQYRGLGGAGMGRGWPARFAGRG